MKISIIICTHSPRPDYLRRTLDALKVQTLSREQWELLLIDNASKEPLALAWDLSWHPHARHIREDELGLTPARVRGIRESKGELLIFVDDDNVLALSFLETALSIHHKFGQLGAFGAGQIIAEFERQPDNDLKPYLKMLSIRDDKTPAWANFTKYNGSTPWGAGLCVLREVGLAYAEVLASDKTRRLLDRRGNILLSCGDIDLALFACKLGFGTGVFPELSLVHLIPSRRLERKYLVELAGGNAASHLILSQLWGHEAPAGGNPVLSWFRHMKRLFTLKGIDREVYQSERQGIAKANEWFAEHR